MIEHEKNIRYRTFLNTPIRHLCFILSNYQVSDFKKSIRFLDLRRIFIKDGSFVLIVRLSVFVTSAPRRKSIEGQPPNEDQA